MRSTNYNSRYLYAFINKNINTLTRKLFYYYNKKAPLTQHISMEFPKKTRTSQLKHPVGVQTLNPPAVNHLLTTEPCCPVFPSGPGGQLLLPEFNTGSVGEFLLPSVAKCLLFCRVLSVARNWWYIDKSELSCTVRCTSLHSKEPDVLVILRNSSQAFWSLFRDFLGHWLLFP